jgi:hypothetical protein
MVTTNSGRRLVPDKLGWRGPEGSRAHTAELIKLDRAGVVPGVGDVGGAGEAVQADHEVPGVEGQPSGVKRGQRRSRPASEGGAPPQAADGATPADVIASFARWHGLLDLAWTPDAALIQRQINADGDAVEVVLDTAGEAAYLHLAARLESMWGLRQDLGADTFPWER